MALRYDVAELKNVERTPQGGLRVGANLTRTGVFKYLQQDGSMRAELRHPDDVFSPKSIESFKGAPVTDLHPTTGPVSPENWKALAVGHVGDDVRPDGDFVAATLSVQDAEAIRAIEAGDRREISMGYSVDLVPEVGEYNGEKYDARQTNIFGNHCAIGPKGWGRAGGDVSLRLDSNGDQRFDSGEKIMTKVRIDGVDYEIGSETHIAKLDSMHRAEIAKIETAQAKILDAEKGRADTAEKALADATKLATEKLATEKARADKADADLAKANDPKALHTRVQSRLVVIDSFRKASAIAQKREPDEAKRKARKDADDVAEAGSSDVQLMASVVKMFAPDFESSSDDEIRGAFKLTIAKLMKAQGDEAEEQDSSSAYEAEMEPGQGGSREGEGMDGAPPARNDSVYGARRGGNGQRTDATDNASPEARMRRDNEARWTKLQSRARA